MAATGKFVAAVGETLVDVGRITSDKESVTLKPAKKSGLERDIKADLRRIYKPSQKNRLWHKYSFLQGCIVDLQGLIAVGKSTIGQSLYDFLTWLGFEVVLCLEEIPEPLLGLYGKEMKKYAFPFQTIVASHRLTVHSDGIKNGKGKIWITDRGLLGDYVFALMQYRKGFFTEEEFQAYMEMVGKALPEPDYVLHVCLLYTSDAADEEDSVD